MGASSDGTLTVIVGDGLAGDVEMAHWASMGPSYGEAPAQELAAVAPSLADLAMVQQWGGLSFLVSSDVPIVAANLLSAEGDPLLVPYRVVECAGRRVALLGLAQPGDWLGAQEIVPQEAVRLLLPKVSREALIVVLLSNAGPEVDRQLAANIQGIDVIIGGGEEFLDSPEMVGHTLLVRPGYQGRSVGVLWLTFDHAGRLTKYDWERVMYMPQG